MKLNKELKVIGKDTNGIMHQFSPEEPYSLAYGSKFEWVEIQGKVSKENIIWLEKNILSRL